MAEPQPRTADARRANRCLIADDVRSTHRVLSRWLRDCGLQCESASDGHVAWERLQSLDVDLLITDIEMPQCSGLELLQRIRNSPDQRIATTPVLVMTSLDDRDVEGAVQKLGGDGLLIKPLEKNSTLPVILEVIVSGVHGREFWINHRQCETQNETRVSPTLQRLLRHVADIDREM
ncbi:response regulator [Neorhodopirellula pilleata]|uniref:Chemotaxis protein CheY n=1 Tax=Neorhodopirellula pilleata TaxID=2714738 RepID=A0A5C6A4M9_9BACT|nr:response regulator [Neorhodopirellula pilleata]TWT94345.1 Chemotaxis protein CheY [Neorhodopirellula pilleata]